MATSLRLILKAFKNKTYITHWVPCLWPSRRAAASRACPGSHRGWGRRFSWTIALRWSLFRGLCAWTPLCFWRGSIRLGWWVFHLCWRQIAKKWCLLLCLSTPLKLYKSSFYCWSYINNKPLLLSSHITNHPHLGPKAHPHAHNTLYNQDVVRWKLS